MLKAFIRSTSIIFTMLAVLLSGFGIPGLSHHSLAATDPASASSTAALTSDPVPSVSEWSREFGNQSAGNGVIATSDGGYLLLGNTDEIGQSGYTDTLAYIVKTNSEGVPEWETKINYSSNDSAKNAVETRDGGFLVIGSITDYSEKPYSVVYLVKLDANGNIQWESTYDDPSTYNNALSVIEADNGEYVIAGFGANSAGIYTAFALRTDIYGNQLWYNKYKFGNDQVFYDITPAVDGGFIAVGSITRQDHEPADIQNALLIVKLNEQGNIEWTKQYQDTNASILAYAIIPAKDEGYLIGNRKNSSGQSKYILTKIDVNGSILWEKNYPAKTEAGTKSFNQLVSTEDGYALIGSNVKGTYPNQIRQYDVLTVDDDGQVLGDYLYEETALSSFGNGAAALDGGFIVTGTIKLGDSYRAHLSKLPKPAKDSPPAEPILTMIAFTDNEKKIPAGSSVSTVIQAVYSDGSVNDLSNAAQYRIEDPSIAEVDSSGNVTGISPGNTRLLASYEGLEAALQISVLPKEHNGTEPETASFYLDSTEYSLSVGERLDTRAFIYDEATSQTFDITHLVTFWSDNPEIADYDEEGNLVGHKAGIINVYASYNGDTKTASVQIVRSFIP